MEYNDGILSFSYAYTGDKNGYRVAFCDVARQKSCHYAFLTDDQIAYACMHKNVIYVFTQTENGQTRMYCIPVENVKVVA